MSFVYIILAIFTYILNGMHMHIQDGKVAQILQLTRNFSVEQAFLFQQNAHEGVVMQMVYNVTLLSRICK